MAHFAKNLTLLAILTSPVWAQGPGPGGRGGTMRTPAFTALDSDGDGTIAAAEIAKAAAALKVLDKNGDGKLTEDEVRPAFGGRRGGGEGRRGGGDEPGETAAPSAADMVKALMAFDKNGDGNLTRDEVPERMQGLFDRADADKNGILSAEEIAKVAQPQPAVGRGDGEGRGEGQGEGRGGGRGEGMSFMKMDPILAALDMDGDGTISAAELANAPATLLKLDKNQDGKLTEDEVRPTMGFGRGGRGPGQDRN